jgi:hypothetical protein
MLRQGMTTDHGVPMTRTRDDNGAEARVAGRAA